MIWLFYTFTAIFAILVIALVQARRDERTWARAQEMLKDEG